MINRKCLYQGPHRNRQGRMIALGRFMIVCIVVSTLMQAQQNENIARMLEAIHTGSADSISTLLPELAREYPDETGYVYLMGITEHNGDRALRYFQSIVECCTTSEWRDDALYRLYQYHYAIGAYNTADKYLSRLELEYPSSPYLNVSSKPLPENKEAVPPASLGDFAVQIAVFSTNEDAEIRLDEMKRLGYSGELRAKVVGGKTLMAVWVGRFTSLESARTFAGKLNSRHRIDAIVVRR